jgi:hypothetical protein
MSKVMRIGLMILLFAACALSRPSPRLAAQTTSAEEQGPEAFVPTERLPAGSAVSFPVDI